MTKTSRLITVHSSEQTTVIARRLGRYVPLGTVFAAYGNLGMGKTCFAAGLARGLGLDDVIVSPTYVFFRLYQGESCAFAHIDAYRLEGLSEEEIALTGIEDCFAKDNIVFVEWPGFIREWLPEDAVEIHIGQGGSENERLIEFIYDKDKQGWLDEAFSY